MESAPTNHTLKIPRNTKYIIAANAPDTGTVMIQAATILYKC